MRHSTYRLQKGATLLISLIILLILTIIGIATMSSTGLQSSMARNFQLTNTDFQLAETTIEELLFRASQGTAAAPINYDVANDIIRSVNTSVEGSTAPFPMTEDMLDPVTAAHPNRILGGSGVKTDAVVTFLWQQESEMCPGGAGTGACNTYAIAANTSLDGVTPGRTHTQIITTIAP